MNFTLHTPSGYWNPLLWVAFLVLFAVVGYIIYSRGNPAHKTGEQAKPYLSGNEEPDVEEIRVRASDIYWGFLEALKGYYRVLIAMHTGDLRDYIYWYIGVGTVIILIFLGGL